MRSHHGLAMLAAVLTALILSACGSSSSSPTSSGASVGSSAMRATLQQQILSTANLKAPEAKKIVDCIITKLSAAGIKTNGQAASHENQVTQFSTACAEKIASAGG
jgi:ABC-type phosphate/phosphonate transport system substrate-binding protein